MDNPNNLALHVGSSTYFHQSAGMFVEMFAVFARHQPSFIIHPSITHHPSPSPLTTDTDPDTMARSAALLLCLCAPPKPFLVRSFRMTPPHPPRLRSGSVQIGGRRRLAATTEAAAGASKAKHDERGAPAPAPAPALANGGGVDRTVTILQRGPHHVVALKPPAVVCHHSGWAGSRAAAKRGEAPEIPMLQRVRDALRDLDARGPGDGGGGGPPARRVNLVHRLDRGASGALLLTYADDGSGSEGESDGESVSDGGASRRSARGDTAQLIEAMQSPDSVKTYVALVRGEGVLRGEDLTRRGWFEVSRPIKDDRGEAKDASTLFNFVAGQPEASPDRPRVSLVLARPRDGRWHQIRRHLNGLSHPILGDSTHGHSKTNGVWKRERNLPGERIALHLGRLQLVPTENIPEGIDAKAPMLEDMLDMLRVYAPGVLERSLPVLKEEGILIEAEGEYEVGAYTIPEALLETKAFDDGDVEILEEAAHYVVARKPPVVVVHHSSWTGRRTDPKRRWKESVPMLQRVRDRTDRRVNLVHRLDRSASGCLLLTFAENNDDEDGERGPCGVTRTMIESMQSPRSTKTYVALCDGDGEWNGVNYLEKGWFTLDKPVKDERGSMRDAQTDLRFVASTVLPPVDGGIANAAVTDDDDNNGNTEGRKVSIVLARPRTGRWHQVRQHLASGTVGHAILGDSSHGRSRTNRIWKKKRRLMKERTCLHLARLELPPTEYSPEGVDVACPLPPDLVRMLRAMPREFLEEARPILAKEGVDI